MSELTLALSELAGRVGVEVSSKDTPKTMADSIVGAFEESKPLELSATEKKLSLSFRESKIEQLREAGVSPAITNRLTALYCADTLSLSNDDFELVMDLISDVFNQKVKLTQEKTSQQVPAEPPKSVKEQWHERTRAMKPV